MHSFVWPVIKNAICSPWLSLLLVYTGSATAQDAVPLASAPPRFDHLGTATDSFPTDIVTCIREDAFGLMWFGTQRGLVRFDGSGVRRYRHDPHDVGSLPGDSVEIFLEDTSGRFWVGTNNGLGLLDRFTGRVTRFPDAAHQGNGFIWSLQEDGPDHLWIGTGKGLFRLHINTNTWSGIEQGLPAAQGIRALLLDRSGTLWVGTEAAGLWSRAIGSKGFTREEALPIDASISALAAVPDKSDLIWAGTDKAGLYRLSSSGITNYQVGQTGSISNNQILAITVDRDGNLWAGTDDGLNRYHSQTNQFAVFREDPSRRGGLSGNRITALSANSQGLLWIGTTGGGADRLNLNQGRFWFASLPNAEASAVLVASDGTLWIGTKREGLLAVDRRENTRQTYLARHMIRSLAEGAMGEIWVGTMKGLFRVRDGTAEEVNGLEGKTIWSLATIGQDQLWAGTRSGLYRIGIESGEIRHYPARPDSPGYLNNPVVSSLALDQETLWIATFGGGLNRLDTTTGAFSQFLAEDGLSNAYLLHLHMARDGMLWIATYGGGLNRFNPQTGIFRAFTTKDAFPDNAVTAINEDGIGRIWASCGEGLVRIDPALGLERHVLFQVQHGLPDGGMLAAATARDPVSGMLYFGSVNGMTGLHPSRFPVPSPPRLAFTSVKKGGKEVAHLHMPGQTLDLSQREKTFSLELSVLDYLTPQNHATAYRRLGLDDDWEYATGKSHVSYTKYFGYNMGGDYVLEVKGTNGNGVWRENGLPLTIEPPWWRAWLPLFTVAGILALVLLTYLVFLFVERRRRQKLQEQARLAEERARVAERREELEREARRLQEEHTAVLQEHLEQVSTEIANDLHDGPLSALHGLGFQLAGLGGAIADAQAREHLDKLSDELLPRVRDSLRNVCGELLTPEFEEGLVPEVQSFLDATVAAYPGIQVETSFALAGSPAREIQVILFRVFRTLIKNVVKHAGASNVQISITGRSGSVSLEVEDDGKGFQVPESWEIFKKDKHYGMYMAGYFAESVGGSLRVVSAPGEGTRAMVTLPLREDPVEEAAS